jgi:hypothetical protein
MLPVISGGCKTYSLAQREGVKAECRVEYLNLRRRKKKRRRAWRKLHNVSLHQILFGRSNE